MIVDFPDSPAPSRILQHSVHGPLCVCRAKRKSPSGLRTKQKDLYSAVHCSFVIFDHLVYLGILRDSLLVRRANGFRVHTTHDCVLKNI